MTETSKNATYKYFNGKEYERINFKTTADQIDCNENRKFITEAQREKWDGKADKAVATKTEDGLMSMNDKKKLDGIATSANNYIHPTKHAASMIETDPRYRFVTEEEKREWSNKASKKVATVTEDGLMSSSDKRKVEAIDKTIKKVVLDNFYPVGSIYMSVRKIDPSNIMGGTWEEWGKGRVPVGVDDKDKDFGSADIVGGAKTVDLYAHIGAFNSNPETLGYRASAAVANERFDYAFEGVKCTNFVDNRYNNKIQTHNHSTPVTQRDGKLSTSIVQPYITCYMWKRKA